AAACPRQCTCYVPTDVHCTFRYLAAVPDGLSAGVERINLGYNSIAQLGAEAFANLGALELLMLHSNNIQSLPANVFKDLGSMQVLKMSYNKVKVINRETFHGMGAIVRLHLDHNKIEFVHPDAFGGLSTLRLLHLEGNLLRQLHPNTFVTFFLLDHVRVSAIRHLHLSDNALESLPRDMMAYLGGLESLYLHGNPWACDCSLLWLLEWERAHEDVLKCKRDRAYRGGRLCATCASPSTRANQELLGNASRLSCSRPAIRSPLKLRNSTLWEGSEGERGAPPPPPPIDLQRPIGSVVLNVSDENGNRADLACNVQRPREGRGDAGAGIPLPRWEVADGVLSANLTYVTSLACELGPEEMRTLWKIVAFYSEAPLRLAREIMLSKEPHLSFRYKQAAPDGESRHFTGVRAAIAASPAWLMQDAIELRLDRRRTTLKTLYLAFTAEVSDARHLPGQADRNGWAMIRRDRDAGTEAVALSGGAFELDCRAFGFPKPTVRWILPDGTFLSALEGDDGGADRGRGDGRPSRVTASADGRLAVRAAVSTDAGTYRCVATAREDHDVLAVRVEVLDFSSGRDVNGAVIAKHAGDALALPCAASGAPDPSVRWILPDGTALGGSSAGGGQAGGGVRVSANGTLTVEEVGDGGYYHCIAVNSHGVDLLTHRVVVKHRLRPPPLPARGRSTKARIELLLPGGGVGAGREAAVAPDEGSGGAGEAIDEDDGGKGRASAAAAAAATMTATRARRPHARPAGAGGRVSAGRPFRKGAAAAAGHRAQTVEGRAQTTAERRRGSEETSQESGSSRNEKHDEERGEGEEEEREEQVEEQKTDESGGRASGRRTQGAAVPGRHRAQPAEEKEEEEEERQKPLQEGRGSSRKEQIGKDEDAEEEEEEEKESAGRSSGRTDSGNEQRTPGRRWGAGGWRWRWRLTDQPADRAAGPEEVGRDPVARAQPERGAGAHHERAGARDDGGGRRRRRSSRPAGATTSEPWQLVESESSEREESEESEKEFESEEEREEEREEETVEETVEEQEEGQEEKRVEKQEEQEQEEQREEQEVESSAFGPLRNLDLSQEELLDAGTLTRACAAGVQNDDDDDDGNDDNNNEENQTSEIDDTDTKGTSESEETAEESQPPYETTPDFTSAPAWPESGLPAKPQGGTWHKSGTSREGKEEDKGVGEEERVEGEDDDEVGEDQPTDSAAEQTGDEGSDEGDNSGTHRTEPTTAAAETVDAWPDTAELTATKPAEYDPPVVTQAASSPERPTASPERATAAGGRWPFAGRRRRPPQRWRFQEAGERSNRFGDARRLPAPGSGPRRGGYAGRMGPGDKREGGGRNIGPITVATVKTTTAVAAAATAKPEGPDLAVTLADETIGALEATADVPPEGLGEGGADADATRAGGRAVAAETTESQRAEDTLRSPGSDAMELPELTRLAEEESGNRWEGPGRHREADGRYGEVVGRGGGIGGGDGEDGNSRGVPQEPDGGRVNDHRATASSTIEEMFSVDNDDDGDNNHRNDDRGDDRGGDDDDDNDDNRKQDEEVEQEEDVESSDIRTPVHESMRRGGSIVDEIFMAAGRGGNGDVGALPAATSHDPEVETEAGTVEAAEPGAGVTDVTETMDGEATVSKVPSESWRPRPNAYGEVGTKELHRMEQPRGGQPEVGAHLHRQGPGGEPPVSGGSPEGTQRSRGPGVPTGHGESAGTRPPPPHRSEGAQQGPGGTGVAPNSRGGETSGGGTDRGADVPGRPPPPHPPHPHHPPPAGRVAVPERQRPRLGQGPHAGRRRVSARPTPPAVGEGGGRTETPAPVAGAGRPSFRDGTVNGAAKWHPPRSHEPTASGGSPEASAGVPELRKPSPVPGTLLNGASSGRAAESEQNRLGPWPWPPRAQPGPASGNPQRPAQVPASPSTGRDEAAPLNRSRAGGRRPWDGRGPNGQLRPAEGLVPRRVPGRLGPEERVHGVGSHGSGGGVGPATHVARAGDSHAEGVTSAAEGVPGFGGGLHPASPDRVGGGQVGQATRRGENREDPALETLERVAPPALVPPLRRQPVDPPHSAGATATSADPGRSSQRVGQPPAGPVLPERPASPSSGMAPGRWPAVDPRPRPPRPGMGRGPDVASSGQSGTIPRSGLAIAAPSETTRGGGGQRGEAGEPAPGWPSPPGPGADVPPPGRGDGTPDDRAGRNDNSIASAWGRPHGIPATTTQRPPGRELNLPQAPGTVGAGVLWGRPPKPHGAATEKPRVAKTTTQRPTTLKPVHNYRWDHALSRYVPVYLTPKPPPPAPRPWPFYATVRPPAAGAGGVGGRATNRPEITAFTAKPSGTTTTAAAAPTESPQGRSKVTVNSIIIPGWPSGVKHRGSIVIHRTPGRFGSRSGQLHVSSSSSSSGGGGAGGYNYNTNNGVRPGVSIIVHSAVVGHRPTQAPAQAAAGGGGGGVSTGARTTSRSPFAGRRVPELRPFGRPYRGPTGASTTVATATTATAAATLPPPPQRRYPMFDNKLQQPPRERGGDRQGPSGVVPPDVVPPAANAVPRAGAPQKPRIITDGGAGGTITVTVAADADLYVDCQVEGNPPPTVTWMKVSTGAVIKANSRHGSRFEVFGNGTLAIRGAVLQDRGQYVCTAANTLGAARLAVAVAVSAQPPRILVAARHRDVTVPLGSVAELACPAEGRPAPQRAWVLPDRTVLRGAAAGPAAVPATGAGGRASLDANGTLRIADVAFADRGPYKCVASNSAGADTATVRLHVLGLPPSMLQGRRSDVTARAGAALALHCAARGTPAPSLRWVLAGGAQIRPSQYLDGRLFVYPNGTLLVKSVAPADAGAFECLATNSLGADRSVFVVTVEQEYRRPSPDNVPPPRQQQQPPLPAIGRQAAEEGRAARPGAARIVASTPRRMQVSYGATLQLACNASGTPAPRILWRLPSKKFVDIYSRSDERTRVLTDGSLVVAGASEADAGDYLCLARNSLGDDAAATKVEVLLRPARIDGKGPGGDRRVRYGGDFQFDCVASGVPNPEISWKMPDGTLVNGVAAGGGGGGGAGGGGGGGERSKRFVLFDNGTLFFDKMGVRDQGDYTCYAENKVGRDEMVVRVLVETRAARVEHKERNALVQASSGSTALLECLVSGEPAPRLAWSTPNGEVLLAPSTSTSSSSSSTSSSSSSPRLHVLTDGSLEIRSARRRDAGDYTCSARNAAGSDARTVRLAVRDLPPAINGLVGDALAEPRREAALAHARKLLDCRAELRPPPDGGEDGDARPPPRVAWAAPGGVVLQAPYRGGRLAVHANGTLEIRNARPSDSAEFVCVARSGDAESRLTVRLEVVDALEAPSFPSVAGGGDDETVAVEPGRRLALLNCSAEGSPRPRVAWTLPGGARLAPGQSAGRFSAGEDGALRLSEPGAGDAGRYRCTASNVAGAAERSLRLEFGTRPWISPSASRPGGLVRVVGGESTTLDCAASGDPPPAVSWTLPGGALLEGAAAAAVRHAGRFSLLPNGSLVVSGATVHDRGNYMCRARSRLGEDSRLVPVVVIAYPPRITAGPPRTYHARPGTSLQLSCLAIGIPRPDITWELPDRTRLSAVAAAPTGGAGASAARRAAGGKFLVLPQGALVIPSAGPRDSGVYRCTARNLLGSDVKATYLYVL
ncbi:uncharacterized protein LOC144950109, partial [Lampetra fluviatilis]